MQREWSWEIGSWEIILLLLKPLVIKILIFFISYFNCLHFSHSAWGRDL